MAKETNYKKKINRDYLVSTLKNFLLTLNTKEIGLVEELKTEDKTLVPAVNDLYDKVLKAAQMVTCDYSTFTSLYQHIQAEEDDEVEPFIAVINEPFIYNDIKYPADSYVYGTELVADPTTPGKYTYDWKIFTNTATYIGNLEDLTTIDKDTLVIAINELDKKQGDAEIQVKDSTGENISNISDALNQLNTNIGDITGLTTTDKVNLVSSINELKSNIGVLDNLTISEKENLVKAINFMAAFIGDYTQLETTDKSSIVAGINSNKKEIGNIINLDAEIRKDSLTEAVNESYTKNKVAITEDTTQLRYSNVFTINQNNTTLATIRVPKDYYISNAILYVAGAGETAKDTSGTTLIKNYHYIQITIAQSTEILYVNVESLYNKITTEANATKIQLDFNPAEPTEIRARIVANSIDKEDLKEEIGKTLDFSGWADVAKPLNTEAQTLRGGVNELKDDTSALRNEFGKIIDIDLPESLESATQVIQYLQEHKLGYISQSTYENWNSTIKNSAKSGDMWVITNNFTDPAFDAEATYKKGTWLYCVNGTTHTWIAMNNGGGGIETLIKEVATLPPLVDAKSDVIYVVTDGDKKKAYIKLDTANQWLLINGGQSDSGTWLGNAYYYEDEHTGVKWETYFALAGQAFLNQAAMSLKGSSASESDIISIYTNAVKPTVGDTGTYYGQYIYKSNNWEAYSQLTKATKNVYGVTKLATDDEFIAKATEYPVTPDLVHAALENYALKNKVYEKTYIDELTNEYYKKTETYTKTEIEGLIGSIRQVKRVDTEEQMKADKKIGTLYYVGTIAPYAQWLCISATEFLNLGTSDIDLTDYYKKQDGVTNQCIATLKNIDTTKTIQQLLDAKMEEITGAASSVVVDNLEKGMVLVSNSFTGKIDVSDRVSNSELNQLDGIDTTQTIQTLLDNKQAILKNQENIKSINNTTILGAGNLDVQETLVSGTNIKTINNNSILGAGNIEMQEKLVSGVNIKTIDGKNILITGGETDLETIEDVTKINNTLAENRVYHLIKEQGGYQIGGFYIRNKYTDEEGSPQDEWVRLDNVVRADTITTVSSLTALGAPLTTTVYRLKTDDGTYKSGYYIYYKNDAAGAQDMGTGFICISKDENSLIAGTGLDITSAGVINHSNSITTGELNVPDYSGGITTPKVTYDTEGHISAVVDSQTIYAPKVEGTKGLILLSGGTGTETNKTNPTWASAGLTWYATCGTGASTQAKEATCAGFSLGKGHVVSVKFTETNTIDNPTLNINSTGAKDMYWGNEKIQLNNAWAANDTITFIYDGTYYRAVSVDKPQCLWGTCSTAVGTAAKTVTVPGFHLHKGAIVNVSFTYPHISSTAATLNVNSTGAKTIRRYGMNITTNNGTSWCANDLVTLVYDGTYWNLTDSSNIPVGTICMFGGANIPAGWLYCNGNSLSRTTYSKLYGVIGTNFGSVDTSTFKLPDFRQKFPEGAGNAGLTNAEYYNLGNLVTAGLPDIYGSILTGVRKTDASTQNIVGAFNGSSESGSNVHAYDNGSNTKPYLTLTMRASKGEVPNSSSTSVSNLVYGKNKGVQPNAIAVHFMIRYL